MLSLEKPGICVSNAETRNQDPTVLSRHSGMPLAGIHSGAFLDSGQNRAGIMES